jgi:hypothetical protein
MPQPNSLLGVWEKQPGSPCGGTYPQRLVLLPDGTYRGQPAEAGQFIVWDVGTYRFTDPDVVEISTANDAVVAYRFAVSGDFLEVTDPNSCKITFARVG